MRKIKTSNSNLTVLISEEDYVRVSAYAWRSSSSFKGLSIKARIWDKQGKCYKHWSLSRFILNVCDQGIHVDHINCDRLDNRRENLRLCTPLENSRNKLKRKNTSSKYKGVYKRKCNGKFSAQIKAESGRIHLGDYESEYAAALAYDLAAKSWFGEFAKCNILSNGAW